MGRTVGGPPAGKLRTYVPAAFDNRQDPEPVEVDILEPTEADRRAFMGKVARTIRAHWDEAKGDVARDAAGNLLVDLDLGAEEDWQTLAVERFVAAVRNYNRPDERDGRAITVPIATGKDLARYGDSAIFREVAEEIRQSKGWGLGGAEKKDSGASSPSSTPETGASNGTAASVSAPASVASADAA